MGLCGSGMSAQDEKKLKDEKALDRAINKDISNQQMKDFNIHKLLLLGAGESGKSTLFKQMLLIYGKGFSEEDKREYFSVIHANLISSMKTLVQQSDELRGKVNGTTVSAQLQASKQLIEELKENVIVDDTLARHIYAVWRDPGIQTTYANRSMFQLTDSCNYFCEKVGEISRPGWLPSQEDILRCRVRTTGIVENEFQTDGNHFKMYDVGGQRNERKKWIHCFSDVTAVLFVGSLSEYDQVLYEDESTNRMMEALNLFDEICNSRWFKKTSMILMLNKRDLFSEKIQKVPLTKCFPEYSGPNTYESASQYILDQFLARNKDSKKQVYRHFTCATDTNNMRVVFGAVKDIVIRRSLEEGGLLH